MRFVAIDTRYRRRDVDRRVPASLFHHVFGRHRKLAAQTGMAVTDERERIRNCGIDTVHIIGQETLDKRQLLGLLQP